MFNDKSLDVSTRGLKKKLTIAAQLVVSVVSLHYPCCECDEKIHAKQI
jgi:hypothetical protein